MRVRPWPLIILAILQFFSPVATIYFNAWALGVKPHFVLHWILEKPPIQVFETMALMPIAGVAIYFMKRWSYGVFFAAMAWSLYSNLNKLRFATQTYSIWMIVLLYVVPVGLVVYFMIPSVRRTYLDPRVRWWESKRRYLLEVPLELEADGAKPKGKTQNISEGGALIQVTGSELKSGQKIRMKMTLLSIDFEISGTIMYAIKQTGVYGVCFEHSSESQKRFRDLMKGLDLMGVPNRDGSREPWYMEIFHWTATVLKTGKGLVPDVNESKKS